MPTFWPIQEKEKKKTMEKKHFYFILQKLSGENKMECAVGLLKPISSREHSEDHVSIQHASTKLIQIWIQNAPEKSWGET